MNTTRALSPSIEPWPNWLGRLGVPESWQQFLESDTIKVEEYREDDVMVVRAELPGVDPDTDIDVTVEDGMLRIHAERSEETHAPKGKSGAREHYRSEFRYGSFTRVLPLPAGVTETDVTATYRDGILEVRAPTNDEQSKVRKVEVARS